MNESLMSRSLWAIFALFVICFYSLPAQGKYGGGSGTPVDPYLISDANHMQAIGADPCDWDKCFKLMADIDLGGYTGDEFNLIGDYPSNPFTGVFDGNNHTISNFIYDSNSAEFIIGLFGYVDGPHANIKDLGLVDPDVNAGASLDVGALVGYIAEGTITHCYVEGGYIRGADFVGGLIGANGGDIFRCYSTGSVTGNDYVGGLVGCSDGYLRDCIIINCYAIGSITGNNYVGGLLGWNARRCTITDCYATGNFIGNEHVGGLMGLNSCYGGPCSTIITNSYWDIETSGELNMCGSQDGGATGCNNSYGLPTSQLHQQSTFTDWDFINTWNIGENQTYPYLRTVLPSDINKDRITNFLDIAILCEEWLIEE
jgi:hypothetical protein